MEPESFRRKLAGILSADVAGYNRLMQSDEAATIKTLQAYKRIISNLVAHRQLFYSLLLPIAVACSAPEQVEPMRLSGDGILLSQGGIVHRNGVADKSAQAIVPNQVLVRFREGTDQEEIQRVQRETGVQILKAVSNNNLFIMKIMNGSSVEDAIRRLKGYPEILYAEPNYGRVLKDN
jgi:hypothetical protein